MAMVKDEKQKEICKETMENLEMNVIETSICNSTYEVTDKKSKTIFWQDEKTAIQFMQMPLSKYIVSEINEILENKQVQKAIDVGCGGGRYSRYLKQKCIDVLAVDKYKEMAVSLKEDNISFMQANMDNIPVNDDKFELILSIGVIHNAITKKEFIDTIKEFYRILKNGGYVILSVFTNDVITDDLKYVNDGVYDVLNRPSMVLLSKDEINKIIENIGFSIDKKVDEHITDVGIGKRNVYTIRLRK